MYNVSKALEKYRGLIRWTARKYSIRGNFRMSIADLEAEGLLVLVKCCRSFPKGQRRFGRYFKRSWYNHLKTLSRISFTAKRFGKEVGIDDALHVSPPDRNNPFITSMRDRANELSPCLSGDARRLLQVLTEPSEEVMHFAWKDFCRKRKLLSQGINVLGGKRFRIRIRHIRGALGMSKRRVRELVREIRTANLKLKGESKNG
jgi:hypothetical protein